MSHSSQVTKAEYSDKHEANITSKMANMWERKIGSDIEHKASPDKASPTSVLTKSVEKVEPIRALTKTASTNKSDGGVLSRKNTREMVQTFERMASSNEQNNFGGSGVAKKEKRGRKSGIPIPQTERKGNGDNHDELKSMINRICKRMNDLDSDINRLKQRIDAL